MSPDLTYIVEGLRALAVPLDQLKPDPKNARKHGSANLAAIRSSFEKYGQVKPIAARRADGVVLAGNGRLRVATDLGWTHIAVVWMDGTPEQLAGFALVDNKSAELAGWDDLALSDLMRTIDDAGVDLSGLGFQSSEIEKLLDIEETLPPMEMSDAPPPQLSTPPRAPDKTKQAAAKKPKTDAEQRPFDPLQVVTAEEWEDVEDAAEAIRMEQENPELTLGACLRFLARRYMRGRPSGL